MILTKKEITSRLHTQQIVFTPNLDEFQLQPSSVDLRLGWSFYTPITWKYNELGRIALNADYLNYQKIEEYFKLIKLNPGQYYEILPNEFIIVSTLEKITLNCGDLVGTLYPRSSAIRRGLQIQAGVVDCYYDGQLTVPVVNTSNHIIKLYPGERIVQLQFSTLASELTREEAQMHGRQTAKYSGSTPYGLEAKTDNNEELDLIKLGKIDELKNNFKLNN